MQASASKNVFKEAIKLSERVAVYIPSTTDVDQAADSAEWVSMAKRSLSERFGGATSTQASGGWVSDQAGLVSEDVTIVYAYTDELTDEDMLFLSDLSLTVKYGMKQEAVSVEINDSLYLV